MSKKQSNKKILFISYSQLTKGGDHALNICSKLTADALRLGGYEVNFVTAKGYRTTFLTEFRSLLRLSEKYQILYITVDGLGFLSKFTLIKLFNPNVSVVWEIHGVPKESLWGKNDFKNKFMSNLKEIKHYLLARLVSGSVCLSKPLADYAVNALGLKRSFIIPSFYPADKKNYSESKTTRDKFIKSALKNDKHIQVLWGGGAGLRWQALDVIEKVAEKIYQLDPNIIFLIVGSNKWHTFNFTKNIVFFESVSHSEFLHFIRRANICLALYHSDRSLKITGLEFYFSPRKIIEYMMYGKPVIATDNISVSGVIQDGKNGFLTNNSVDQIVMDINLLADNPQKAIKIGLQAVKKVGRFDLSHAVVKYRKAVSSICA